MILPVLLAAGASTRMGVHKLLLDFGGEPLVRRSAQGLLAAGFDEVLVVTGRDPQAVHAALDGLPVRFVHNPDFARSEVPGSLLAALDELGSGVGVLMALADMPFVGAAHYGRVLEAGAAGRPVLSRYGGVTAPPHLVPAHLISAISAAIRSGRPKPIPSVLSPTAAWAEQPPEDLEDLDTPEDHTRALGRLAAGRL